MPVDAPVLAGLVQELNRMLPLKIEKIFQPYPEEIIFNAFGSGVSCKILISLHSQYGRLTLFDGVRENPAHPSAFCMLLRKHFGGGKLIGIKPVLFERICRLTFEVYDQYQGLSHKGIWLELTGKSSNLIITDNDDNIIDRWRKTGASQTMGRELAAGVKYEFPGTGGRWEPVSLSWEQFQALVSGVPEDVPIEKFLLKHWYGLSPLTVREITGKAGIKTTEPCGSVPAMALEKLYRSFQEWSQALSGQCFEPSRLSDPEGQTVDCSAFMIHYPPAGHMVQNVTSLNRTVSDIMERHSEGQRFDNLKNNLLHMVKARSDKARTKYGKQQAEADAAEQGDSYRIMGELLTTYGSRIQKGAAQVTLLNHYHPDPANAEMLISLNPALTAQENAQIYFKKYQKAKKGRQAIALQLRRTQETIDYFESVETLIQNARNLVDLSFIQTELDQEEHPKASGNPSGKFKNEPAAEPRRFVTPEGDLIYVGRNNLQNDRLTFKIAGPNDLWFHTQKIPGSHVILKLKTGNSLTDAALNYACQLAAYFSKARQSTKIPVDYTPRKHVNKPSGSKPGFVIYHDFKSAIITPDPEILGKLGV
jgi:predicted ribosome quality control (RQC) complex YloA/Tae2 family protein